MTAAMTCASMVSSGGCEERPVDVSAEVLDPADACQDAVEAGLLIHSVNPLNGETSVPDLAGGAVMPNGRFYLRNHFDIPNLGGDNYRLSIGGLVERPLKLSMRELHNLHAESQVVTLECAGNGRSLFDPAVPGEAWGLGAVSTAEWTGVRLMEVLGGSGLLCPRIPRYRPVLLAAEACSRRRCRPNSKSQKAHACYRCPITGSDSSVARPAVFNLPAISAAGWKGIHNVKRIARFHKAWDL
nr:molybdopterin-dependent oxidoreductase [Sinorhizobium meliloti]